MGFWSKKSKREEKSMRIAQYMRRVASRRYVSRPHRNAIVNASNYLQRYEEYLGNTIESKDFDYKCVEALYLFVSTYPLKRNTVIAIVRKITACVNMMQQDGYKVGRDYSDYKLKEEEVVSVTLSDSEIERLYMLDLQKSSLRIIRDLFVFACDCGLRYSDLIALQDDNIKDNILTIKTKKTGAIVYVPLRRRAREIIKRNHGVVKYKDSQANYNNVIKTLCKRAGICDKVLVEYTKGGKIVRKSVCRYTLVSSHTARRSFATNAYLAGIPTARIMMLTGHKTEESFFRYIRIGKTKNAKELQEYDFFKE